jgi:hypothetical protein
MDRKLRRNTNRTTVSWAKQYSWQRKISFLNFLLITVIVVLTISCTLLQDSVEIVNSNNVQGNNRTLVFVHVGKTGGETIKWRLRVICNQRASKRKKALCLSMFHGDESALSKKIFGYIHCDNVRPRDSLYRASTYLYSLRDPVDRVVSWYQYMHPRNCLLNQPSAACNLKKGNNPWGLQFYGDCFPTVNDLFRLIAPRESVPQPKGSRDFNGTIDRCSHLAVDALQGRGPEGPTNHLYFNYYYLANQTIMRHPDKEVMVVRLEFLWKDLQSVEIILGGNPRRHFQGEGPIITHGSEKFPYQAELDETAIRLGVPLLCCVIYSEIHTYLYLLSNSVNLKKSQKEHSIRQILTKCEAKTVEDLHSRC